MGSNPKVCVQTDELENERQWVSVIANGDYEELPEFQFSAERRRARYWKNAIFGGSTRWRYAGLRQPMNSYRRFSFGFTVCPL
jgi:nitroimidazol reductase NimA-like FMN-containing flavoprotein (pyridoxamine 5'-phosphate oxidase superfamily)